ncbi:MAG: outer membrane beta-barrel protein [Verrucomicrobia bacterium]|nr:outer membrane beta-barrel protein [Verrucomicrobiota bacterium]
MRLVKWVSVSLVVLFALQVAAIAKEGARSWQIHNRLRLEYDDNIRTEMDGQEDSSFKVIEEVEALLNANMENTFISLRLRPSFVWWDDRPEDQSDVHVDLDFILNQRFNPRTSLSVKDGLRRAELPSLEDDARGTLRMDNDYTYNTLNALGMYKISPQTRVELEGRHILLRYDENAVADTEDFDILVGGASVRHQFAPDTVLGAEARYETISYDSALDRDSDTIHLGGSVEQTFSPNLLGNARAGWQRKEFDAGTTDSTDAPYGDVTMSFIPSPQTRMTVGASYSFFESSVTPFLNQNRARFHAAIAHDLTAKIALYLSAGYIMSEYDGQETPETAGTVTDGNEDVKQLSARVTYKVNRSNWLEASWQYTDFESDLAGREDYERNRFGLGWKVQL